MGLGQLCLEAKRKHMGKESNEMDPISHEEEERWTAEPLPDYMREKARSQDTGRNAKPPS